MKYFWNLFFVDYAIWLYILHKLLHSCWILDFVPSKDLNKRQILIGQFFEIFTFHQINLLLFMILSIKNIKLLMNNNSGMIIAICIYGVMAIMKFK